MKQLTTRILFCTILIVAGLTTNAQRTWNSSFVEIGLGVRTLNSVPTNVFIKYDENAYRQADFGGGTPLAANLGFVFLPDQKGLAGKFAISGYLGSTSGFGIDLGIGYKIGNEKFSFAPMFEIELNRLFSGIESYAIDSTIVQGSNYNSSSTAVFVGNGVKLHDGNGSDIKYNINFANLDLRLGAYVSYNVANSWAIFGRVGYNFAVAKSKAKFEATGKGYDNQQALENAVLSELAGESGEGPKTISVEIDQPDFMIQNGNSIDKIPFNMSGFILTIGVGISINK